MFTSPLTIAVEQDSIAGEERISRTARQGLRTRITYSCTEKPIETVLMELAEQAQVDIVKSPKVTGNVTVKVTDVPLEEALTNILAAHDYTYIATESMIRVVPLPEITVLRGRLVTRIHKITYADANEVATALSGFVSQQGRVAINRGTSHIIITDTEDKIRAIDKFIEQIDLMTPQVLVEVRIYDITTKEGFNLGAAFHVANMPREAVDAERFTSETRTVTGGYTTMETTPGYETTTTTPGYRTTTETPGYETMTTTQQYEIDTYTPPHTIDTYTPEHKIDTTTPGYTIKTKTPESVITTTETREGTGPDGQTETVIDDFINVVRTTYQTRTDTTTETIPKHTEREIIPDRTESETIQEYTEYEKIPEHTITETIRPRTTSEKIPYREEEEIIPTRTEYETIPDRTTYERTPEIVETETVYEQIPTGYQGEYYRPRGGRPFVSGSFDSVRGGTLSFSLLNDFVDIELALSILQQQVEAKLLANPRVLVLDNQTANFEIIRQVPYRELLQVAREDPITYTEFKDVGVSLNVTPHIARDGMIRLHIMPEFGVLVSQNAVSVLTTKDDFGRDVHQNVLGAPTVDTRRADTTALIRDGQTIVIGGLRKRQTSKNISKVPVLGDMPIIGGLFKSETESVQINELVIFITTRIVTEPVLSGIERKQLEATKFASPGMTKMRLERNNRSKPTVDKFKVEELTELIDQLLQK